MIKISQDLREFGKVDLEFSNAEELKVFLNETVKVCDHYGCKELVDFGIAAFKKSLAPASERKNEFKERVQKIYNDCRTELFDSIDRKFSKEGKFIRPSAKRLLEKTRELGIDLKEVSYLCDKIDQALERNNFLSNEIFHLVVKLARALKFNICYDRNNKNFNYRKRVLYMIIVNMYEKVIEYPASFQYEEMIRELIYDLKSNCEELEANR